VAAVVLDWSPRPRRPCVPVRLGVAAFPGGGGPARLGIGLPCPVASGNSFGWRLIR